MAEELKGKKILLVDDDRDILAAMSASLSETGAEIITAIDGNAAIEEAEKHMPDLVVLDMMLPKRSGFLVMEKLRSGKPRNAPPRVIMITGNQGSRHRAYAQSLGIDDYLVKPFRMEKLIETAKKLLTGGGK